MLPRRHACRQPVCYRPHVDRLLAISTPISIENPETGELEQRFVTTFQKQQVLDSNLKSSDFDLDVQIRSGVKLEECQPYLKPATIEDYNKMISHIVNGVSLTTDVEIAKAKEAAKVKEAAKAQQSVQQPSNINFENSTQS